MVKNNLNLNRLNGSSPPPLQQSGISLAITLIGLVAMTMAGLSIMRASNTSNLIAGNMGFHQAAVQSADLGVETAITVYKNIVKVGTVTSDDTSINYYASYDSINGIILPDSTRLSTSTVNVVTDSNANNEIHYVIERMCNDANPASLSNCLMNGTVPYFRISTLVNGPRGTSANTQVYVSGGTNFNPDCALTVQTYVDIPATGQPNLQGDQNCIHSNDYVNIAGSGGALGEVRAVNAVGVAGNISGMGGTSMPSQPAVVLPVINPADFKSYADFVFETDGHIWEGATDHGTSWIGWSRTSTSPDIWSKSDNAKSDAGLYYFEGNVELSGTLGSSGSPWNVSFIASKAIQISSVCYFDNYHNPSPSIPDGVNNILLMAGGDLEYNGNPTQSVQGIIAAGEEININGNPNLEGYIIATNANNPDPSGFSNHIVNNALSGNFTLNHDSGTTLTSPWENAINRHAWRSIYQ